MHFLAKLKHIFIKRDFILPLAFYNRWRVRTRRSIGVFHCFPFIYYTLWGFRLSSKVLRACGNIGLVKFLSQGVKLMAIAAGRRNDPVSSSLQNPVGSSGR